MKILALMTFDIFRFSLGAALQKLGHTVRYLGDFTPERLDAEIVQFQPDMIVDMGWDVWQQEKHQRGELASYAHVIAKRGAFHLYFAEEDWLHFERWSKRYCEIMRPSFVLTRSPIAIRRYEEMGIPATYFDVGCNPSFHRPVSPVPAYACDVAVVANGNFTIGELRFKSIRDLVLPLLDRKIDLKIWGRDWPNLDWCYPGIKVPEAFLQGKLPFTETPKVYSSAKINISIQTSNDQLSNRTLDVMATGGFLLTSNTKAVREKLRPGVDCAASGSPAETLELVDYYLRHEEERKKIAEQGRMTALQRFAYQRTLLAVWPEIEAAKMRFDRGRRWSSPRNLLKDGDFTLPGETAWVAHQADRLANAGYKGSASMAFQAGTANAFIQQTVPVKTGKSYLLQAWFAKAGSGTGAPVNLMVQYYSADHKLLEFGLYGSMFFTDLSPAKTHDWWEYRGLTAEAPAGADYALILINKIGHEDNRFPVLVSRCSFVEYV